MVTHKVKPFKFIRMFLATRSHTNFYEMIEAGIRQLNSPRSPCIITVCLYFKPRLSPQYCRYTCPGKRFFSVLCPCSTGPLCLAFFFLLYFEFSGRSMPIFLWFKSKDDAHAWWVIYFCPPLSSTQVHVDNSNSSLLNCRCMSTATAVRVVCVV